MTYEFLHTDGVRRPWPERADYVELWSLSGPPPLILDEEAADRLAAAGLIEIRREHGRKTRNGVLTRAGLALLAKFRCACGEQVTSDRLCFAVPTCHDCLPPPTLESP